MSEFASGAIIGSISVLTAWFFLGSIDRKNKHVLIRDDGLLTIVPAYKRFVVVAETVIFIAVFAILNRTKTGDTEHLIFLSFAVVCIWFGARMFLDVYGHKTKIDKTGIHQSGLFRKQFIAWADIEDVQFDQNFNVFVIRSKNSRIRVSKFSLGVYDFLDRVRKEASETSTRKILKFLDELT